MEILAVSIFDLVVLGVAGLAGLVGLITGFVRGGLFLASWILAIIITLFVYPSVLPLAENYVDPGLMATLAAAGGTFLASLVVLLLLSQFVAKLVRSSHLNMLDRSLGLVAGVAIAVGVLALVYLPLSAQFPDDDYPAWIGEAKTRPIIEQASTILLQIIPEEFRPDIFGKIDDDLEARRFELESLAAAPPLATGDGTDSSDTGYTEDTRDQLEREIQGR